MILKKYCYYFCLLFVISFAQTYSQSLGIVYEASPFNVNGFYNSRDYSRGMIKNIFISFNGYLNDSFQLSFKVGYGWNIHKYSFKSGIDESLTEDITSGIPFECEVKYQHFMEKDSVFEPLIGIGIGYYNYNTTHKSTSGSNKYSTDYSTEGLGQYIVFGLNIHMSNRVTSSIQFKKIMIHSITTECEVEGYTYKVDYGQQNGFNDLGILFGVYYNL